MSEARASAAAAGFATTGASIEAARAGAPAVDVDPMNLVGRLADGSKAVLGQSIATVYLGQRWEARITALRDSGRIDIVYTNDAGHRALGCESRSVDPWKWLPA